MNLDDEAYDLIIVGAGPAGCVLASRLSADATKQVLLIDAGPDAAIPGAEHPEVLDTFPPTAGGRPTFVWQGLLAESGPAPRDGSARALRPLTQGFGVGGGSNVNGMAADRGLPDDYEEWQQHGATGWDWAGVLPFFKKLEHDLDFGANGSSLHGTDGLMPVRRLPRSQWPPFAAAVAEALERRGYPYLDDYKTDFRDGVGSVPTNCLPDRRMSAAMVYLNKEVRRRPNLTILANAPVDRICFDGKRASGIVARINGVAVPIRGREVIVSCGALQSPTLLLRSGVGPSEQLMKHGIPVIHHLPGVGANLQNHPVSHLTMYLAPQGMQAPDNRFFVQNWLRFSSHHPQCHPHDMQLMIFNKCAWHALGSRVAALAVTVLKPYSKGRVELATADPNAQPHIHFNLLDDPRDYERLAEGLRFTLQLLTDAGVMKMRRELFVRNHRIVASLGRKSVRNRITSAAMSLVLDQTLLRRMLFASVKIEPQRLLGDEESLHRYLQGAHPQAHVCGTCRMGRADDPNAVVDSAGKVRGVEALRVVDASVFPTIPRGHLHFIVLMTAEKMAETIKADWRHE
jgi:5-(hydroxymethyl)furfural/furfural oxidase